MFNFTSVKFPYFTLLPLTMTVPVVNISSAEREMVTYPCVAFSSFELLIVAFIPVLFNSLWSFVEFLSEDLSFFFRIFFGWARALSNAWSIFLLAFILTFQRASLSNSFPNFFR